MITASGLDNGRPLLLLGLSRTNCERLLAGQPIRVHTADVGVPMTVVIVGGETEDAIADTIAPMCGPHSLRRDLRTT